MSLAKISPWKTAGTYIEFLERGQSESGKTKIFEVHSTQGGGYLGEIKWFGRWRRYCFFPSPNTAFEQVCMRDISDFIELKTKEHKL